MACYRVGDGHLPFDVRPRPAADESVPRPPFSPTAPSAASAASPQASGGGLEWLRRFVAERSPAATTLGEGATETGARWQTLLVTSQTWRGVAWSHELDVVFPAAPVSRGPMLLWVGGGTSLEVPAADGALQQPPRGVGWLADLVAATGLPAAKVRQVPFQPMFGGMMEDDLVAHSFVEFVRSGDPDWPLLLPMTRAVAAAMDVAGDMAGRAGFGIDGFVLGGASKRGWASWLAAAADSRVVGLIPAVIDMLRLERHVPLQLATFGGRMSEMLDDYTSRGIEQILVTKRGRELVDVVDPWSHRAVLQQPKIVALGTNDPYWPLGALDLYRDGLLGTTAIAYSPNAGHGIPRDRLTGLLAALLLHTAGRCPLPTLRWSFESLPAGIFARLACDELPAEIVAWHACADGPDFRLARWTPLPHHVDRDPDGGWMIPLPDDPGRSAAALVECRFDRAPHPLWLSTSVHRRPPASLASSAGSR